MPLCERADRIRVEMERKHPEFKVRNECPMSEKSVQTINFSPSTPFHYHPSAIATVCVEEGCIVTGDIIAVNKNKGFAKRQLESIEGCNIEMVHDHSEAPLKEKHFHITCSCEDTFDIPQLVRNITNAEEVIREDIIKKIISGEIKAETSLVEECKKYVKKRAQELSETKEEE